MARKEINVFNVSFLDLLSGALGAVLILFIVIPKMDAKIEQQLQELEAIKSLKVDVQSIQSMMQKLDQSVPQDEMEKVLARLKSTVPQAEFDKISEDFNKKFEVFANEKKELEQQMQKVQTVIASLEQEIKKVQTELGKCDQKRTELKKETAELKKQIKTLEEQNKDTKVIRKQLADCEERKKTLEKRKTELESQLKTTQDQVPTVDVSAIQAKVEELKNENESLKNQLAKSGAQVDRVGIEIDKKVVFAVDISGSMDDSPEPQKLDEIKAGLKMLVATMTEEYSLDIVIYPISQDVQYEAFFGQLKKVTPEVKYQIYRYINKLRAFGCTPTRQVMEHILNDPAYKSAGTVMLMSDGLPTLPPSEKCADESWLDVVSYIGKQNAGKRVINTIGVGAEFRDKMSQSAKVKFMKKLARENNGFYIGF